MFLVYSLPDAFESFGLDIFQNRVYCWWMDKLLRHIQTRRSELIEAEARLNQLEEAMTNAAERYVRAERHAEDLKIELRALEQAAELRPTAHGDADEPVSQKVEVLDHDEQDRPKRGGRQAGAISVKWRRALADILAAGNEPIDMDTFYLLTRGRLGLTESSVRERVRNYVASGILDEQSGKVKVSSAAIVNMNLRSFISENNSASPAQAGEAVN